MGNQGSRHPEHEIEVDLGRFGWIKPSKEDSDYKSLEWAGGSRATWWAQPQHATCTGKKMAPPCPEPGL